MLLPSWGSLLRSSSLTTYTNHWRLTRLVIVVQLVLLVVTFLRDAWAELVPPAPLVQARAAFLVQAQSGAVLYEKHAFEARPPASLTKMVTALVVVERCPLDAVATASARAAAAEGSRIGLVPGDRISVGDLLTGLMLPSGNDAATCLAEYVAGSEATFADLMNAKAAELGAVNTHFTNASGLSAEGHYSCARDLAVFALAVRSHPYLSQTIRLPTATIRWVNGRKRTVANLNRLLGLYPGCDGVKTGFTTPAGRCLAASAQRDGYALMCVALKSPDAWSECASLLDWGFAQPPVAVVAVDSPRLEAPLRLPSPLIGGRLHVPIVEFIQAWGYPAEPNGSSVIANIGGEKLQFNSADGLAPIEEEARPAFSGIVWRGKLSIPVAPLCRLLGMKLAFDKQTLTATVGLRDVSTE